jgi:sphingolipid delta-4 desaturase
MHIARAKEIFTAHPQVKALMRPNRWTALWALGLVVVQMTAAWAVGGLHWLWIPVAAYLFGAFANHALYVLIHECTHNLVFRRPAWNNLLGIWCDFALAMPGAMAFRKYHLMHHQFLGHVDDDPDVVSETEARLVGNAAWRKAAWVALLGISQALRPMKIASRRFVDRWIVLDIVLVAAVDIAVAALLGPGAFAYLALSTVFALGLHPVGGRWIQEHYTTSADQETTSYYGPLNRVCFNMGYHVEHHDFANVPWNNLPKLKRLAPEFYDGLVSYRSWTAVLWRFIFDPRMSTYSRIVHSRKDADEPRAAAE